MNDCGLAAAMEVEGAAGEEGKKDGGEGAAGTVEKKVEEKEEEPTSFTGWLGAGGRGGRTGRAVAAGRGKGPTAGGQREGLGGVGGTCLCQTRRGE